MAVNDCLPRPSITELRDQILSEYRARVLAGRPVPDGDLSEILAFIYAGAAWQVHGDIRRLYGQLFLESMCPENVIVLGDSMGLGRKPATLAHGWLELTGTPEAAIPSDIEFTREGGLEYVLDPDAHQPIEIDANGVAVVFVRATTTGPAGNVDPGGEIAISSAADGIDATATVSGNGIVGGANQETAEELRQRLIRRRRTAVSVGNLAWYRTIILSYPGVTRVCFSGCDCIECCVGPFVTAYPFLDAVYPSNYGVAPQGTLNDIQTFVWGNPMGRGLGKAPAGAIGQCLCAAPAQVRVTVRGTTSINPAKTELVRAGLVEFFRARGCVGETICGSELSQAINAAVPGLCFGWVEMTGDDVTPLDGNTRFKIACSKFPVLQHLSFSVR